MNTVSGENYLYDKHPSLYPDAHSYSWVN